MASLRKGYDRDENFNPIDVIEPVGVPPVDRAGTPPPNHDDEPVGGPEPPPADEGGVDRAGANFPAPPNPGPTPPVEGGRTTTKPRENATPSTPKTPTPVADEGGIGNSNYVTPPSVTQPMAGTVAPIQLRSPSAQSLVTPMGGGGRMFGKAGGLLEGGYGLPDMGGGEAAPSDLLMTLIKLLGNK